MGKVIITAAVNGNRPDHPGNEVPVSPEEIAEEARRCHEAGAAVVHFHARDVRTRRSTADVSVFADTIRRIRAKCNMLIETTTGIGPRFDPETGKVITDPKTGATQRPTDDERLALIEIDPPQDVGSLAAGSINTVSPMNGEYGIFPNSPYYIEQSVARMAAKPKLAFLIEIFDISYLNAVERLSKSGALAKAGRRYWLNYILGFGGLKPDARSLAYIQHEGSVLFPDVPWGFVAPNAEHYKMHAIGAGMGADCLRTGFEDVTVLPNGEAPGSNAPLVEAVVKIVRSMGREVASPAEARQILGLNT